jgi:hypothetical protein
LQTNHAHQPARSAKMIGRFIHVNFTLKEMKGKTKVWTCRSNYNDHILGEVAWYAPWRKYCFFPNENTLFDHLCLNEIHFFVSSVNQKNNPW